MNSNAAPYIGAVKVGPKGQIVIPKEARDMFGIMPGDSLVFLAHPVRGMGIVLQSELQQITDAIYSGIHRSEEPASEEHLKVFAEKAEELLKGDKEK